MEKLTNVMGVEYIVSDDGRIFSTKNIGRGKYHKELSQRENIDGYMMVTVGKNGERRTKSVHRIIAEAFIDNPLGLPEVDHIDRNRKNNSVDNLRWISSYENKCRVPFEERSESHKHEKNGRSKLTMQDVELIRELYRGGKSIYSIAKDYGRGYSTISHIVHNETWI